VAPKSNIHTDVQGLKEKKNSGVRYLQNFQEVDCYHFEGERVAVESELESN